MTAKMNASASCVLPSTAQRNVQRTGTASVCAATPSEAADRAVGANMLHNDDVSDAIAGVAKNVKAATDNKLLILVFYGYLQAGSYEESYAADLVAYGHLSGKQLLVTHSLTPHSPSLTYSLAHSHTHARTHSLHSRTHSRTHARTAPHRTAPHALHSTLSAHQQYRSYCAKAAPRARGRARRERERERD